MKSCLVIGWFDMYSNAKHDIRVSHWTPKIEFIYETLEKCLPFGSDIGVGLKPTQFVLRSPRLTKNT